MGKFTRPKRPADIFLKSEAIIKIVIPRSFATREYIALPKLFPQHATPLTTLRTSRLAY